MTDYQDRSCPHDNTVDCEQCWFLRTHDHRFPLMAPMDAVCTAYECTVTRGRAIEAEAAAPAAPHPRTYSLVGSPRLFLVTDDESGINIGYADKIGGPLTAAPVAPGLDIEQLQQDGGQE